MGGVVASVEPASTGIVTASATASHRVSFSASVSVGASPVVPASDEALVALVLQPAGQRAGAVEVEGSVVGERRDHRREDPSEGWHAPEG